MGMNVVEKIMANAAGLERVAAGDNVDVRPHKMIAYDFPGYTDRWFKQLEDDFGVAKVAEPERYLLFIDHMTTRRTRREQEVHDVTRDWARRNGVAVHEGQGIGHQVMAELGLAVPGRLYVHMDGHISGIGALGALGWGIRFDILEAWVTGSVNFDVPESVRFDLEGQFAEGVDNRDLIHYIIRTWGADGCVNKIMEYRGPGARQMSIGRRQGLCAMAMFAGAVSAIFPYDDTIADYLAQLPEHDEPLPTVSDDDATYAAVHQVDLSALEPQVVLPGSARSSHTVDVTDVTGRPLQRGFIGSCASGRIEDLRQAAEVLRGRRVADGFKLIVSPTSERIKEQAEEEGLLTVFEEAGASIGDASCDFCYGYAEPLGDDDNCISTGVLNISGRMGSTKANIYMANAYTIAASAVAGQIADPRELRLLGSTRG